MWLLQFCKGFLVGFILALPFVNIPLYINGMYKDIIALLAIYPFLLIGALSIYFEKR